MSVKPMLEKAVRLTDEQIISRGSPVKADLQEEKEKWMNFTLRIRKNTLNEIDLALEEMEGLSKTAWILQAIREKLNRTTGER